MEYDIFISYSRKDFKKVKSLVEEITAMGIKVWFDLTGIEVGEPEFDETIIKAIDDSDSVLFIYSENSIASPWTKKEVMYAKQQGKKVIPILLDGKLPKHGWVNFHFGLADCIDLKAPLQKQKLIVQLRKDYKTSIDEFNKIHLNEDHDDSQKDAVSNPTSQTYNESPRWQQQCKKYFGKAYLGFAVLMALTSFAFKSNALLLIIGLCTWISLPLFLVSLFIKKSFGLNSYKEVFLYMGLPLILFFWADGVQLLSHDDEYFEDTDTYADSDSTDYVGSTDSSYTYECKADEGEIYDMYDEHPQFPGGEDKLNQWISFHLQYPEAAMKNGVEGEVDCSFVVNKDGSITDVTATADDDDLKAEAIRLIKAMPKWTPGKINGNVVRTREYHTIAFKLK